MEFARLTHEERAAVDKIAERYRALCKRAGVRPPTKLAIQMDLSAVHATTPLRLQELADADDFNLSHDISGIHRHLNRGTGRLDRRFLPRFARSEARAPAAEERR